MDHIRKNCLGVTWKASYVELGRADYLDIFTRARTSTATKVATIIRTLDHATTEVWAATEWEKFTSLLQPAGS
jgi:hypothetical protein